MSDARMVSSSMVRVAVPSIEIPPRFSKPSWGDRAYKADEVDVYLQGLLKKVSDGSLQIANLTNSLDTVKSYLLVKEDALSKSEARVKELTAKVEDLNANSGNTLSGVAKEIAALRQKANDLAEKTVSDAKEKAAALLEDAEEKATALNKTSEEKAAALKEEADNYATSAREEAEGYSESLKAKADAEYERLVEEAANRATVLSKKADEETAAKYAASKAKCDTLIASTKETVSYLQDKAVADIKSISAAANDKLKASEEARKSVAELLSALTIKVAGFEHSGEDAVASLNKLIENDLSGELANRALQTADDSEKLQGIKDAGLLKGDTPRVFEEVGDTSVLPEVQTAELPYQTREDTSVLPEVATDELPQQDKEETDEMTVLESVSDD